MKKLLIVLAAVLGVVIFIVPISGAMLEQGFRHRDKSWAPGLVYSGARLQMRLLRHAAAAQAFERAIQVFPKSDRIDRMYYLVGVCYDKQGQSGLALQWYQEFLVHWPAHQWAAPARRRISQINELEGRDL